MLLFCKVYASGSAKRELGDRERPRRRRGRLFRPRESKGRASVPGNQQDANGAVEEIVEPQGWSVEYSREFIAICDSQFEVLAQVADVSRCVLYLRRDSGPVKKSELNSKSKGKDDVEFVPVCQYPTHGQAMVVGEEHAARLNSQSLPGGVSASVLIPEYPFLGDSRPRVAEDASLTVPIQSGQDVVGILSVWKTSIDLQSVQGLQESGLGQNLMSYALDRLRPVDRRLKEEKIRQSQASALWSEGEKEKIGQIAKTLALACSLDQRTQNSERSRIEQMQVLSQLRTLLSTVLHQVRSPLGAMVTFGKLLLRRLPVGDVSRDLARDIVIQSERMQELLTPLDRPKTDSGVTDVQYFELEASQDTEASRSEDSTPAVENEPSEPKTAAGLLSHSESSTCWLSDLVQNEISSWQTLAAEASLRFLTFVDVDAPPCKVDDRAVIEVMNNLVNNAFAYTPTPGTVEVTIAATEDERGVYFCVRDTGYGIGEDELPHVFEKGFRGEAARISGFESVGDGLGLTIAKEIAEFLEGKITVESPSGIGGFHPGTTVTVTFNRFVNRDVGGES